MNVAYVTSYRKQTGAGTHAEVAMEELGQRDGIDLTAVQTQQTDYPETFVSEGGSKDVDFQHYDWVFPNDFQTALLDLDPDVVIVHTFNTELFTVLKGMQSDLGAALVYRHGTNMFEQWASLGQGRPRELAAMKEIVWDLDFFDMISVPTQTIADRLSLYYGDDIPDIVKIPNPIRLKDYTPSTYFDGDRLKVVMASRIRANNYAALPILAVRRLVEDVDISLRVLGGGDSRLLQELQLLAGDSEHIEFLGHVDRTQVRRTLERADVACVPSISHNAVPFAALEALAAGCVVLASASSAMAEEEAIVKLPHEDPSVWYDALRDAHDDVDECKQMVRDGLTAARKHRVETIIDEGYMPMLDRLTDS